MKIDLIIPNHVDAAEWPIWTADVHMQVCSPKVIL